MPVEPQRSGGTSDGQTMPPPGSNRIDAESVGHLSQSGHLVMGPGARRDTAAGKNENYEILLQRENHYFSQEMENDL